MQILLSIIVLPLIMLTSESAIAQTASRPKKAPKKTNETVSFKKGVFPIIKKNCLPCHDEDNMNPSELSMDDYEKMEEGGKHGSPWVAGKSTESLIIKKLSEEPPFGDRMPLNSKKKISEGRARWLTDEEIRRIAAWIDEGARNN